ncbi:MAG: SDR family oxidoreductase [Gammaproteobacteria bacterium]|jgi:NAD(P)-dependent dehydrogenase (short-subunit alcohol dehydrogenase family)|nr:SDR family oxidoreductase [Gammaproteobacteria bacterium]
MFNLEGKNAYVTGAAGGIGRAVAERYLKAGARVVITDIMDASGVSQETGAIFHQVDVSDEQQLARSLAKAEKQLGKLDIVVNNAGIGDVGFTLEETEQSLIERTTRINQWGVLYGLKHAPKYMNNGGSIINTSSMAAIINLIASGVYSATKAAVISMTRMSALELGDRGIRVNAVCPGYIATALGSGDEGVDLCEAMTALGRVGTTDDLTGLYHFLASDESGYLTGQALQVDGGWSCGPSKAVLEKVLGRPNVS